MQASHAGPGGRELATTLRRGGIKVARGLKRRLRPDHQGERRSPEAPRLLFRPGTGGWVVAHDDRWYEPSEPSDLDALLTLLPAEVLDDQILGSPRSSGGFVRVVDHGGDPTLEFLTSFGEVVRRTASLLPGLRNVTCEWTAGVHPDGWVETSASLRLDRVRRCTLTAFLPEIEDFPDFGDKQLAIQRPEGRRTTVDIHRLTRGAQTRIDVYRSRTPANGVVLTLQTSRPEPADDDRPLGFIVTSLEAYA